MPEEFLKDEGVPARWKVLAVVQGFWIAGKTVYATNDWIQEKLGYSRRQVQYALSELEEMSLITRNVHGMNRLILPGGATRLHGGVQPSDQKGAVRLHHNSVSNSDNINTAQSADFTLEDEDAKPKKATKSANAEYEDGLQWAEKRTGRKFVNRVKQYSALKKAKANGISVEQLVRRWKELEDESFYQEHGLDWMMVLSSFDKRI